MKIKLLLFICLFIFALCFTACGKEEASETTVTGIVTAVDGTTVTLRQFDTENMQRPSGEGRPDLPEDGQMPSMPADGEMPSMPADGEMPTMPTDGEMPSMPADGEMPSMPADGQMPTRPEGSERPDFSGLGDQGETTAYDLSNAHISVEIEGGKASGSMEDITPGCFVTITLNEKGEVTNVLVSAMSGFGGSRGNGFGGNTPPSQG